MIGIVAVSQNESGNNAVAGGATHETTGADIPQFRGCGVVEIVDFDEANAGRAALAKDDSGVRTGRQRNIDRRFQIVSRRDAACLDLGLLGIAPIIVGDCLERTRAVQFENRIR